MANSFLDAINRAFVKPRVNAFNKAFVEPVKRGAAIKKRKVEDAAFMDGLEDEEDRRESAEMAAELDAAQNSPPPPGEAYMADMGDGDYGDGLTGDDLRMSAELDAAQGTPASGAAPDMVDMDDGDYGDSVSGADFTASSEDMDDEIPQFDMTDLTGVMDPGGANFADAVEPVRVSDSDPEYKTNNPLIDPTIGARQAGIPEETLGALFAKTHGGPFDPNSKMDRMKMNTIRDMITEDKKLLSLSPTQFAMKVYGRK